MAKETPTQQAKRLGNKAAKAEVRADAAEAELKAVAKRRNKGKKAAKEFKEKSDTFFGGILVGAKRTREFAVPAGLYSTLRPLAAALSEKIDLEKYLKSERAANIGEEGLAWLITYSLCHFIPFLNKYRLRCSTLAVLLTGHSIVEPTLNEAGEKLAELVTGEGLKGLGLGRDAQDAVSAARGMIDQGKQVTGGDADEMVIDVDWEMIGMAGLDGGYSNEFGEPIGVGSDVLA